MRAEEGHAVVPHTESMDPVHACRELAISNLRRSIAGGALAEMEGRDPACPRGSMDLRRFLESACEIPPVRIREAIGEHRFAVRVDGHTALRHVSDEDD